MSTATSYRHTARVGGALALLLASGMPALAGRYCGDRVESGMPVRESEEEARQAALSWWSSRAGALGRGYENWDVASDKSLDCKQKSDGSWRCLASAKPCLPDGVLPENLPKTDL